MTKYDDRITVIQFGPSPNQTGGMETVLRAYAMAPWERLSTPIVSSSVRGTLFNQLRVWVAAMVVIARSPKGTMFHVHLSHRGSFIREGLLVYLATLRGECFGTVHGSDFVQSAARRSWKRLYISVLRRLRAVAVLNLPTLHVVRALAPRTRSLVVSNLGPIMQLDVDDEVAQEELVVFAGRIGRRKGVDVLIDAWESVESLRPNARLVLLGPIDDQDWSTEEAREVKRHHAGEQPPPIIEEYLRRAACAVLPSRAEGQPMFLIEALGLGVPIVVSNVGAMPSLAADTGNVVRVGDSKALATALNEMLSAGPETARMRESAQKRYREEFSVNAHEAALVTLYGLDQVAGTMMGGDPR